jgi:hypothetical protein
MRTIRRIQQLVYHIAFGDSAWALGRLIVLILLFIIISSLFIMAALKVTIFGIFATSEHAYRWLLPMVVFLQVVTIGSLFLQDIYEIRGSGAAKYILASITGIGYPYLEIVDPTQEGNLQEESLIEIIGGPGIVKIPNEMAVLFDNLNGPSKVLGIGEHLVNRFERINYTADLREHYEAPEPFDVTTKDGIRVTISDVQFRYRVWTSKKDKKKAVQEFDPYPYSIEAFDSFLNNVAVREDGIMDWHRSVKNAVTGAIKDYIEQHQADQVFEPEKFNLKPREEIINILETPGTRNRLKRIGAELVWFDIGNFYPANDEVYKKLRIYWVTEKEGEAEITRAKGEAEKIALRELGQNESQVKILSVIENTINEMDLPEDQEENLRMIFQLGISNILDALSAPDEHDKDEED